MYLLVLDQLVMMMLITLAGFIFAKFVKVSDEQEKFLSQLLLYFINPCLIVNSFNIPFDGAKIRQLLFVVLCSFVMHGLMILAGVLSSKDKLERIGIAFTNCGFIGIPLIQGVFGGEGVFYLMGYLVVFNILLWTYGYRQFCGNVNVRRILLNPNIIAVCIGLVLYCVPGTLPAVLSRPLARISGLNSATAMILIGILLTKFKIEKNYMLKVLRFTVMRLIICPVLCVLVAYGLYRISGGCTALGTVKDVRLMLFVVMICTMCPAATSVPSLACVFNEDRSYSSLMVSVTSLLCIATIPLLVKFAELFIR